MQRVTPEFFKSLRDKIEAPDYPHPREWVATPGAAAIFIDEGNVIFQTPNAVEAERTLYALMRVIAGQ